MCFVGATSSKMGPSWKNDAIWRNNDVITPTYAVYDQYQNQSYV